MRRAQPVYAEVTPSTQALNILEQVRQTPERLLLMAWSGSHNTNPYHNTVHELQHVYYAWSCFTNSVPKVNMHVESHMDLVLASLFHDHNHSGGKALDSFNVARAIQFAERQLDATERVTRLIKVTTFENGEFLYRPETYGECCMRDADLMSIYSHEGRLLLKGLFVEIYGKRLGEFTEDEIRDALSKNESFLFKADMYTDHGNRMRDEHLTQALREFEQLIWRTYPYEKRAVRGGTTDDDE